MSVGLLSGRDAQTVLLCRKNVGKGNACPAMAVAGRVTAERIIRMEQRILQYRKFMDEELLRLSKEQNVTEEEISRIKKEHLVQISFFQHERLVHLIVTVTFALLEMLAILLTVVSGELFPILLSGALLILLIPYVRHYYILENEVQKMYGQYDALCSLSMGNTAFRQRKL